MFLKFRWLVVILFSVTLIQCGGGSGVKTVRYPGNVTPEIEKVFKQAQSLYNKGQHRSSVAAYRQFIDQYPHTHLTDEAYYKIGKIYFLNQKWDKAITEFQSLAQKTPAPLYRSKAYLMMGYSSLKAGNVNGALSYLDKVDARVLPERLKIQFYSLYAYIGDKQSMDPMSLAHYWLALLDVYESSSDARIRNLQARDIFSRDQALRKVEGWVLTPFTPNQIPTWFRNYPSGYSRPYVEFKQASIYFEAGDKVRAQKLLSQYVQSNPKHRYVSEAQSMLSELGGEIKVVETTGLKVGVILPLSGARENFGKAALRGIECAAFKNPACASAISQVSGDSSLVELMVLDSGNDAGDVVPLIDKMAHAGVAAIIGPMSASQALAAGRRAEELNIAVFPFTQKSDLNLGSEAYQMGYPSNQLVEDLVRKARSKGLKSFGIFYPETDYGKEMTSYFAKTIEASGGNVVAHSGYDPNNLDLAKEARELKLGINRFTFSAQKAGFEALFVPDSYWRVSRIVPALQFVTIRDIPLLGTNAWNDEKLDGNMNQAFPGSFFLDLFYLGDARSITQNFVKGFQSGFGNKPTSIEALGFDAVWFIRQAANRAGSTKARNVSSALKSLGTFKGVTSIKGFKNGVPLVDPFILQASPQGITLAK